MKTKISKILGVAVTLALLVSMLVIPTSAGAGTLAWGAERGPSTTAMNQIKQTSTGAMPGLEVVDMAQSGDTIIVAMSDGGSNNGTYKSTDGGWSWTELTVKGNFTLLAIAPDNPDTFVALDRAGVLWYTTDGGARYNNLSLSGITNVNAIDISPGTVKTVIAAGDNGTVAKMVKYSFATFSPSWTEEAVVANGFITGQDSIFAAKFSPNYATDKMIITVSANQADAAYMQVFWDESDMWNSSITGLTDYTASNLDVSLGTASVLTADIAMPSTYMGLDEDERVAYVALATDEPGGGVYRYSDAYVVNFSLWNGNQEGPIYSLAYHDSGILLAGDYNENTVYQCLSPTSSPTAKFSKVNTLKQPGGENRVSVGWYGDIAVAVTQGDETAFAESTDNGYSWNDISLIDSNWGVISDFATNADGSTIYVSTIDQTEGAGADLEDVSIWVKSAGKWRRVYLLRDVPVAANAKYLVRIAPEDDSAVYIASVGTQNIWVSKDSGMSSWKLVSCYKLTADTVVDMAVESADVVYALGATAGVSKTTNAGASWGLAKKPTEGMAGYMIDIAPGGDIIAGGTDGYLSYSQDGGATFKRSVDFGTGNAIFTCDDGYATNYIVYVGIGTAVKRGKITSTAPASTRLATTYTVRGMAQVEGVTYAVSGNLTQNSTLYMSRRLETAATETDAEWSSILSNTSTGPGGTSLEAYVQTPNALKSTIASGTPKLWAIDMNSPALESYTDATSMVGPAMSSPANGAEVALNVGSGQAYDVTFIFDRYSSTVITAAVLEIAADPDFNAIVHTGAYGDGTPTSDAITTNDTIARTVGPNADDGDGTVNYLPGATYYWRVRTTVPMFSEWSETRSFTVESPDTFTVSGPAVGAADVSIMPTFTWAEYEGAIGYQIEMCDLPTFAILELSANTDNPFYALEAGDALDYSTTYYWRVRGITAEPYLVGRNWVTPAGPWVTGVFTTMAEPTVDDEGPAVITITEPAPPAEVVRVEVPIAPAIPTYLLWVIVAVGAILVIALIVLIVRTRRVA
ncbi:WD40/YVTN/BNR-like repeat-containing protein [Chloroflexota bacterium]